MSGPENFFRTISEQGYFFPRPFGPDYFFLMPESYRYRGFRNNFMLNYSGFRNNYIYA